MERKQRRRMNRRKTGSSMGKGAPCWAGGGGGGSGAGLGECEGRRRRAAMASVCIRRGDHGIDGLLGVVHARAHGHGHGHGVGGGSSEVGVAVGLDGAVAFTSRRMGRRDGTTWTGIMHGHWPTTPNPMALHCGDGAGSWRVIENPMEFEAINQSAGLCKPIVMTREN